MRAFIFPGQGSQYPGMGRDFSDFPRANYFFERAREVLGIDMYQLMNSDEETLKLTENAQPAIYLASYIAFDEMIRMGHIPNFVAGHSLGEYTALAAADVYDFETGLYIVRKRGEYISEALSPGLGTMAAVIGLTADRVRELIGSFDGVWLANHNAYDQVVISGLKDSVHQACEVLRRYAKRVIELRVSGPFHTPLLEKAKEKLAQDLKGVRFRKPRWPVVMNSCARLVTDPDEIKRNILDQITGPVRWYESMICLTDLGVKEFVEVGPQRVLTNLGTRSKIGEYSHFSEVLQTDKHVSVIG